jgi:hypothetical protein
MSEISENYHMVPASTVYAKEQQAIRQHAAIVVAIKEALKRGWNGTHIGYTLLRDVSFVGKLLRGHKFKPLTLAVAFNKLELIKGSAPEPVVRGRNRDRVTG